MVWSLRIYPKLLEEDSESYNTEHNILSEEESQSGIEANGKFIPLNSVTAKLVYKLHVSQKFSPLTSKNSYQINLTLMTKIFGHQFIYYLLV